VVGPRAGAASCLGLSCCGPGGRAHSLTSFDTSPHPPARPVPRRRTLRRAFVAGIGAQPPCSARSSRARQVARCTRAPTMRLPTVVVPSRWLLTRSAPPRWATSWSATTRVSDCMVGARTSPSANPASPSTNRASPSANGTSPSANPASPSANGTSPSALGRASACGGDGTAKGGAGGVRAVVVGWAGSRARNERGGWKTARTPPAPPAPTRTTRRNRSETGPRRRLSAAASPRPGTPAPTTAGG